MKKTKTFRCNCGADIELSEDEIIDQETAECSQCGTDSFIDGLQLVGEDGPIDAETIEKFNDDTDELNFN